MTTHLALVGEQPMPVLLIDRHLRPDRTVLVCTERTRPVAERLQRLIRHCEVAPQVAPYELNQVMKLLNERPNADEDVVVNLTGGTKIMMLAAFAHAMRRRHRFVYLESERPPQRLHRFTFDASIHQETTSLPDDLITAREYLLAHLDGYRTGDFNRDEQGALTEGGYFEQAVYAALTPAFDVLPNVRPAGAGDQIEIDLVIRQGNQVAVAEVKRGRSSEGPKKGIDQLSTAGGREYLGTYARKLLITAGYTGAKICSLARERQVAIVEVTGYRRGAPIANDAAKRLVREVAQALAG